jgi:hypothetical protein
LNQPVKLTEKKALNGKISGRQSWLNGETGDTNQPEQERPM